MGIKWSDLSLQQKSMIEGLPSESYGGRVPGGWADKMTYERLGL
jgi:hypothetical protein